MSNPSTIWATLAMPNPAAGSIPFVDTDNATIITDVLNLKYTPVGTTPAGSLMPGQFYASGGYRLNYSDSSGVPGGAVINKPAGRCAIAAGSQAIAISNSFCTVTSIVHLQLETADATLTRIVPAVANGTFTVTGNANATGITKFSFIITNVS